MTAFTEGWALSHEETSTPAEKLVLWRIAATAGTDNLFAEIRMDDLIEFAKVTESQLRETLNSLIDKRLILSPKPLDGEDPSDPRVFECKLSTPLEWHWDF